MVEAHALFSASKAPRWTRCPGSIALEQHVEHKSSKYADEGTAAHTLASWCLDEGQPAISFAGRLIDVDGSKFEVNEDMVENVQRYVEYCNALRAVADMSFVERRVDFSNWIGQPNSFGTSDFFAIIGTELAVVDLKYGMGVQVDAEENEQLMLYALGAYNEAQLFTDIETVRLVIQQPRKQHVSEWTCTVDDLKTFAARAAQQAELALCDTAERQLYPGEKQCKFCDAKAICPALRREVIETVAPAVAASDDGFDAITESTIADPAQLAAEFEASGTDVTSNEILASILPKLDMIADWCEAVKTHAHRQLLNGQEIPGYKLVAGRKGDRAWSDATAVEVAFKSMRLKQDEMYTFKLIGVPAAEKLLKDTPKRWARVSALISQADGKPTLAPVSDKRPALVIGKPEDAFSPVEPELEGADLV